MSNGPDWRDPYTGDDEAARERERRRAEREARRRERQGALGERVRDQLAETPPSAAAPAEPAPAPAEPAPSSAPSEPSTDDFAPPTAARPVPNPDQPTELQSQSPPPAAPPPPPPPEQPARPPRHGGLPPWVVHRRRLAALIGLAALAFVGLVVVVAAKKLGGDDPVAADAPKAEKTISVTIPEGYSRDQVAAVAKKAGIQGDYLKASESAKGFDPGKYGAENPQSLEGFLFPATYEEFKSAKAPDLVQDQLEAFEQNIKQVDFSYAESKNLTRYDVLIIASMIEREVQVPEERAKVAAVVYNRLHDGMPLGIDATTRFAVQNYDKPLTESELAVESPYNTRTNVGLPPGPIANPGLDSIEAAAHPANVDYLYYVVKPGTCGEHVFSKTEADASQAAAEYQAALEAKGSSPTEC